MGTKNLIRPDIDRLQKRLGPRTRLSPADSGWENYTVAHLPPPQFSGPSLCSISYAVLSNTPDRAPSQHPLHTPEPPSPFPTLRAQWNILHHCLSTTPRGSLPSASAADPKWLSTLDRVILLTAVTKKRAELALLEAEAGHVNAATRLQPLPLSLGGKGHVRHDSLAERATNEVETEEEMYTYGLQASPAGRYIFAPWPTPATATFAKHIHGHAAVMAANSRLSNPTLVDAPNTSSPIDSYVHPSASPSSSSPTSTASHIIQPDQTEADDEPRPLDPSFGPRRGS